jgi:MFS family permease
VSETSAILTSATFAPFAKRVFFGLWLANLTSNLGGAIQAVGATWLMASMERSVAIVSLVQVANTLPIMLLALLGGAMADVFDRRTVMIANQIFMLVTSTALAAFSAADALTPALLLGFTFLIACGTALNSPAWQASVGLMVPRDHLPAAVSLNAVGFNVARSAGPALGGVIVYYAGPTATFALNALSYVALIVMLLRWHLPKDTRPAQQESIGSAMMAGVRYALLSPGLRNVLMRGLSFGIAAAATLALLPILARDVFKSGPAGFGLLLAVFGVGAVGGALSSTAVRRLGTPQHIVLVASLTFATATVALAMSRSVMTALPAVLASGAAWILVLSTLNVSVQMSSPQWVKARASALHQMAAFGAMAAGSWVWGALAERFGSTAALLMAAGFLASSALCLLRLPMADYAALDIDPSSLWIEPDVPLPIDPRAGAVAIAIEYRIVDSDQAEFLALVAARGRIRRRDGARNWSLSRDLADPELWIERFISPTWHAYVRQSQRSTRDDAQVGMRLGELHRGPSAPTVRRTIEQRITRLSYRGTNQAGAVAPSASIIT